MPSQKFLAFVYLQGQCYDAMRDLPHDRVRSLCWNTEECWRR